MKLVMSLRSINLTYNVTERTGMAGVIGSPGIFGNNSFYNSPGWNFIFGSQDSEIRRVAAENGWLVKNDYLNNPFIQSRSNNFNLEVRFNHLILLEFNLMQKELYQKIFKRHLDLILKKILMFLLHHQRRKFSLSFLLSKLHL